MTRNVPPEPHRRSQYLRTFQDSLAQLRHGGFIARYLGDGVLCYVGWPRASEDDAERATRARLDILEMVKAMSGLKICLRRPQRLKTVKIPA